MYNVAVIGAGGHVGLPFAIMNAMGENKVVGIDINTEIVRTLNSGIYPYVEERGQEYLETTLKSKNIIFTTNQEIPIYIDVIAIMIGTPVDSENNPRLNDIMNYFDLHIIPFLEKRKNSKQVMILLRSTVAPGTTELINKKIQSKGIFNNYILAFCPERVIQGKSLKETSILPQIIGTTIDSDFEAISKYFSTFNFAKKIQLTSKEAEIAKLACNMYRYINAAFANELYMISENQNVDVYKIIEASNYGYPRTDIMLPGMTAGPCLAKDGKFLVSHIPFNDLIKTSFEINEGFPEYIFNRIKYFTVKFTSVTIYGMTFKKDNDDTRFSLSFKFKKICERNGINVAYHDPFYGNSDNFGEATDVHIIMTPHSMYSDYKFPKDHLIVDFWKCTKKGKESINGFYYNN